MQESEVFPLAQNPQRRQWRDKRRVLCVSSRNVSAKNRYLLNDLIDLLPHSKREPKVDTEAFKATLNETCVSKNCQYYLFIEEKKRESFLWLGKVNGPNTKFMIQNLHTIGELKQNGNCIKGSRPLLCFSKEFQQSKALKIIKKTLKNIFATPQFHPKSQPYVDHILSFFYADERIWLRNYEIISQEEKTMKEIGPRFALWPLQIQETNFNGKVIWKNEKFQEQIDENIEKKRKIKKIKEKNVFVTKEIEEKKELDKSQVTSQ